MFADVFTMPTIPIIHLEQLFKKLFSFCKVSSFVLVGYPEVLLGHHGGC